MNLHDCAVLAERSYHRETLGSHSVAWDVEVYVEDTQDCRFIVFRGTEPDIRDWWTDVQYWPAPRALRYGLLHSGVYGGIRRIKKLLRIALDSAPASVIVLGHSKGGMYALEFAAQNPGRLQEVVTFGTPPCVRLWRNISCPVIRVENYRDPVPRLAPWGFYEPYGDLVWLDAAGFQYLERPANLGTHRLLSTWVAEAYGDLPDHSIRDYVRALSGVHQWRGL